MDQSRRDYNVKRQNSFTPNLREVGLYSSREMEETDRRLREGDNKRKILFKS